MGVNIFDLLVGRWNIIVCQGGFLWQIFVLNLNGFDYKNIVSNGGFFQIVVRLVCVIGNKMYSDWVEKVWDWMEVIGMIDKFGNVYDGVYVSKDCKDINLVMFFYFVSIYIYGVVVMVDVIQDKKWIERMERMVEVSRSFFSLFENVINIMYEYVCEQVDKCNQDMRSFKVYFLRFVYVVVRYVLSIKLVIEELWYILVEVVVKICIGGVSGIQCSYKWYIGVFDGNLGLGQEMFVLEMIQGLLVLDVEVLLKGGEIKIVRVFVDQNVVKGDFEMVLGLVLILIFELDLVVGFQIKVGM